MVLGAGVLPNGQPSFVLQARIQTGVDLLAAGKVDTLIMSGDNSRASYDEVSVMKRAAMALGAPAHRILLDYAGFRTLDSCVRLRRVFGQTEALVVSQQFHLPRAIHLCRSAGVKAYGVRADDPRGATSRRRSAVREVPATTQAWIDVNVLRRKPKFLGPAIDIDAPPPEALEQPLD
jgi:vancomycin permeability regulator SanA